MAERNETFIATIKVNNEQAKAKVAELEKEIEKKNNRLRELAGKRSKAAKEETAHIRAELKILNAEYREQQKYQQGLQTVVDGLADKTYKDLKNEVKQLNKILRDGTIEKNSDEWKGIVEHIKQCKREMKEYETAVKEVEVTHESFFSKSVRFLNKNWGAITQIFGAVTGISATIRSAVNDYASMEEEMADVHKYTGLAAEQIEALNEKFKQMDTRTSREQLNQLAGAAGRLGIQSTEQIEQFVKAADMIGVALGDDLGDGAVDKIGKLAMAFGEDERMGLQKAMLSTGSAINELAQNSAANAGYLVEFTARVAGFGKQLGLTQAQIMGFGTVMDENLLKDEMAATAFGNMLTKMQTDTDKFAKIAGKSIEEFSKLMREDANSAVLAVADSLKRQDPTNMMKMLDSMGLDGSRAVGVLSTLADKIDDVRRHQQRATEAYAQATSVEGEFNTMNNTVQAKIDKCKKKFKEMTIELGEKLLPVVKYTVSGASMLAKAMSVLVGWFDKYKIAIITTTTTIVALVAWKQKDVIVTKLMTLANEKLWGSLAKLGKFLKTNWMGATITAVVALTTALWEMKRRTDGLTESERNLQKIREQAKKNIVEEEQKIRLLIAAAEDEKLSLDERKRAVEKLNGIIPNYNAQLDETTGKYKANKKALDDYLSSLVRRYEIEGAKERLKELGKELADAEVALKKAQESAERVGRSGPASGSQADVFFNIGQKIGANQRASDAQKARDDVQTQIDDLMSAYGEDLKKEVIKVEVEVEPEIEEPKTSSYSPFKTEEDEKKEERKRERKLKERSEAAKAEYQAQIADEMMSYRQGETNYTQYMENRHRLAQDYYDKMKEIYGEDSAEYKKLLDNRENEESQYYQWKAKLDEQQLTMDKLKRDQSIRRQYMQQQVQDTEAMNEALFESEITYMRQRQNLYNKGSKEWMDMEMQIEAKNRQHQFEAEQAWMQKLSQYRKEAGMMDYEKMLEMELKGADAFYTTLLDVGKITQEEYDAIFEHIRKKYAELSAQQQANNDIQAKASKSLDTARKNSGVKDVNVGNDAATGIFAVSQAISQQKLINDQLKLLYGEDYENNREYQEAKRQLDAETMQQIVAGAQAAYSTISMLMSAASSYAQACSEAEVAKITASYDRQIEAAGKNSKQREKLEKQKDEAIAKAKTKANRKAMTMEMAQAVAQAAMGAISAYSSTMAGAPYPANLVLAPISAGIALAAGAVQIATIKKQHEAEAAGYYEGGFTGGHQYRKEAGVVHEGEFVANHQAVENPAVLPLLEYIDQAQQDGTIAGTSSEDLQRVLSEDKTATPAKPTASEPTTQYVHDMEQLERVHQESTRILEERLQSASETDSHSRESFVSEVLYLQTLLSLQQSHRQDTTRTEQLLRETVEREVERRSASTSEQQLLTRESVIREAVTAAESASSVISERRQAQEAGYYEGGFTHGRRYRKEAGVVHEGEFVANHQAVENPTILPFLNFIDQAQRNNTVGSLTMQDVSRALSVGGGSAVAPITPIVNVQTDNEELREAVLAHREATELLLMRLEQPINAQVVLTGPDGLNERQRQLNNMMKNK